MTNVMATLFACATLSSSLAQAQSSPNHIDQLRRDGWPAAEPETVVDPTLTWPLPLATADERDRILSGLKIVETPQADPEQRRRGGEIAEQDASVRSKIGARYSVLHADLDEDAKDASPAGKRPVRVTIFSYAKNRAFQAEVVDDKVVRTQALPPGSQPPETRTEIRRAADLVRGNPRYAETLRDLRVRGILTPGRNGNRTYYLLFYERSKRRAVFQAIVDLTSNRVLETKTVSR